MNKYSSRSRILQNIMRINNPVKMYDALYRIKQGDYTTNFVPWKRSASKVTLALRSIIHTLTWRKPLRIKRNTTVLSLMGDKLRREEAAKRVASIYDSSEIGEVPRSLLPVLYSNAGLKKAMQLYSVREAVRRAKATSSISKLWRYISRGAPVKSLVQRKIPGAQPVTIDDIALADDQFLSGKSLYAARNFLLQRPNYLGSDDKLWVTKLPQVALQYMPRDPAEYPMLLRVTATPKVFAGMGPDNLILLTRHIADFALKPSYMKRVKALKDQGIYDDPEKSLLPNIYGDLFSGDPRYLAVLKVRNSPNSTVSGNALMSNILAYTPVKGAYKYIGDSDKWPANTMFVRTDIVPGRRSLYLSGETLLSVLRLYANRGQISMADYNKLFDK